MMTSNFFVEYDAINSRDTFTNGDEITGRIIVKTFKKTRIKSLVLTCKGTAQARWHYYCDENLRVYFYRSKEKYYEIKQDILKEERQDGFVVLEAGRHVFPFTVKIPDSKIPSTFESRTGKIVHKLKAELKESNKLTKRVTETFFTFQSKEGMDIGGLLEPQYESKDEYFKLLASGSVSMDGVTDKMGYLPGEDLQFTLDIRNNCNHSVIPKITLYQYITYFAEGSMTGSSRVIFEKMEEAIEPSGMKTLNKRITIPREMPRTNLYSNIIKLKYFLKIDLRIRRIIKPMMAFHIVLLPEGSGVEEPPAVAKGNAQRPK